MLARIEHEPWRMLNLWRGDFDRAFNGLSGGISGGATGKAAVWSPAVDIKEEEDAYVLRADVPGVPAKDIDIRLEDGVLTIKGERVSGTRDEKDNYSRVERVSGSFLRRFSLPDTADAENISARSDNGVLEVRIPKLEKAEPRRIAIN